MKINILNNSSLYCLVTFEIFDETEILNENVGLIIIFWAKIKDKICLQLHINKVIVRVTQII